MTHAHETQHTYKVSGAQRNPQLLEREPIGTCDARFLSHGAHAQFRRMQSERTRFIRVCTKTYRKH